MRACAFFDDFKWRLKLNWSNNNFCNFLKILFNKSEAACLISYPVLDLVVRPGKNGKKAKSTKMWMGKNLKIYEFYTTSLAWGKRVHYKRQSYHWVFRLATMTLH